MKQAIHKIASLVMAAVVLFSTLSFTIDMHFCGDSLVDATLFHKVETCEMTMEVPATETCTITKQDCCNDQQTVVSGQDELQLLFNKFTLEQQFFIVSLIYTHVALFEGVDKHETLFKDYKPPVVVKDIHKLDETYII